MSTESTDGTLSLDTPTFGEVLEAATPRVFITPALIAINVVVWVITLVGGVPAFGPNASQVLPWGANYGPLTEHGQWWRLLTACFLHFGFIHLGANMVCLFQAGILAEKLFGNVRYLMIYLFAGLVGNVAGLYVHPMVVSAGASGAVFGVYGALLAYVLSQRGVVPGEATASILKFAGIFLVYNIAYGITDAGVDMVAHLGGLISGCIAGFVFAQPLLPTEQRSKPLPTLAITAGLFALIVGGAYFIPKDKVNMEDLTAQFLTGPSVAAGAKGKVIYLDGATKTDAQNAASALQAKGFFKNAGSFAMVSRDRDGLILSFAFRDTLMSTPMWDNAAGVAGLEEIGVDIAPGAGGTSFQDSPGEREGCDETGAANRHTGDHCRNEGQGLVFGGRGRSERRAARRGAA